MLISTHTLFCLAASITADAPTTPPSTAIDSKEAPSNDYPHIPPQKLFARSLILEVNAKSTSIHDSVSSQNSKAGKYMRQFKVVCLEDKSYYREKKRKKQVVLGDMFL